MGYTIQIGNAIPSVDQYTDVMYWKIETFSHEQCPIFFGDSSKKNYKTLSYSVWGDFCKAVGLEDMFYLYLPHGRMEPKGIIRLTHQNHRELVSQSLFKYKSKIKIPPGFQEKHERTHPSIPEYDEYLARLIWLEFWITWALFSCETPALSIQ
jgi:hypothetical protein